VLQSHKNDLVMALYVHILHQTGISNDFFTFQSTKEPSGLFMPFQVKKDTRLAPEYRQKLSDDQKERLDSCVNNQVYIL
jgi:hypothetical protein